MEMKLKGKGSQNKLSWMWKMGFTSTGAFPGLLHTSPCAWMGCALLEPWFSLLLSPWHTNAKYRDLFVLIKWICLSHFLMRFLNSCQDAHSKKCYESHFLNGLGFNLVLMALDNLRTFDLLNHSYLFYGLRPLGLATVIHPFLVLKCYFLSLSSSWW